MIEESQLLPAGFVLKTHGVSGELLIALSPPRDIARLPYVFCRIEGAFVPFFIDSCRQKSAESATVLFSDIKDKESAARLCRCPVFIEKSQQDTCRPLEEDNPDRYIGYAVIDQNGANIGVIAETDNRTLNPLFRIETPQGDELIAPAHPHLIENEDSEKRTLYMNLPEGLYSV